MSTMPAAETARGAPGQRVLTCAEIWGGNRPIDDNIELPGWHGRVFSRPCGGGRGGDIHYISICNSGLLSHLCVADVAGHGAAVAMVSGEIHRLLRRYMHSFDERRVLTDLNRTLVEKELGGMTTAAAVTYFPPTSTVSVSSAGHPPAWLYRREQERWSLLMLESAQQRDRRPVDLPLGIDPETRFTRRKERVHPGDRLLLLTDGVLEAPGAGGDLYGQARLAEVLRAHSGASPAEMVDAILASVKAHTGGGSLAHDDLTLLLIEFAAGPRAFGIWHALRNRLRGRRPQPDGAGRPRA